MWKLFPNEKLNAEEITDIIAKGNPSDPENDWAPGGTQHRTLSNTKESAWTED